LPSRRSRLTVIKANEDSKAVREETRFLLRESTKRINVEQIKKKQEVSRSETLNPKRESNGPAERETFLAVR